MITIKERFDSKELIKIFNSLENQNYTPMWIDPCCVFVCLIDGKVIKYEYNPDTNRIMQKVISEML